MPPALRVAGDGDWAAWPWHTELGTQVSQQEPGEQPGEGCTLGMRMKKESLRSANSSCPPWGHCCQWELLLGKPGFSFYRFGSLLGEMCDFVMSFVAKL